jgi:hypothetical protein
MARWADQSSRGIPRTRTINISIVKPCASKIASVQPCDKPASNLSTRRWSALSPDFRALIANARRSGFPAPAVRIPTIYAWVSPTISFRWSFDHRRIPGPPLPVWSGSVGATARNCRAARLVITNHMYRETSKPQALPGKRNGLPRGQGSMPPTSQSVPQSLRGDSSAVPKARTGPVKLTTRSNGSAQSRTWISLSSGVSRTGGLPVKSSARRPWLGLGGCAGSNGSRLLECCSHVLTAPRRMEMHAFLKRLLMHYGIYRRYPLGRLPALHNAWRTARA